MTSEISEKAEKSSYPSWLNSDFFHPILRNNKNIPEATDSLSINSIHIESATNVGDNYMSNIYRVLIEYSPTQLSDKKKLALIVKMLPDTEIMGDITDKFNAFPKEILLYAKIIPALQEIWMKAGYPVEFGPKMYFTAETPKSLIVMDDLKALGYKMVPRQVGLSLEEGKTVLAKLANFHAASVIYYDQNGLNYDLLKEGIVRMDVKNELETYYNAMYDGMMEKMEIWDFAAPYRQKLRLWKNKIFDTAYKISQAESTTFNVLNHGDAWTNNLMFNYKNEHPEVLFVDYQLSSWASPAIDLLYFLISAMDPDTIVKHFDDMIKFYHKELSSNFVKLQKPEKIPTLADIEKAIRRKGFLGGMWIIETVPLINANSDFVLDLPAVFEGGEKGRDNKRKLYFSQSTTRVYEKLLPFLDEKGFLDISV